MLERCYKSREATPESVASIDVFQGLKRADRAFIAELCKCATFARNQEVIRYGDPSRDIYFIASGSVRATIYSRSGKEVTFRDIGSGKVFGDLSAIDGRPRSANVVTRSECLLLWMSAPDYWALLDRFPSIAKVMLMEMTTMVRNLSDRVLEFSTIGARNRLHAELLRRALEVAGESNRAELVPPPTHAELANRISSHREAVSREMARLGEAGVVERSSGRLTIPDIALLAEMVHEVKGQAET